LEFELKSVKKTSKEKDKTIDELNRKNADFKIQVGDWFKRLII